MMKSNPKNKRNRRGFTLMEVLLVLVILVILGSLVGVGVRRARDRGFNDAARAQIKLFEKSLRFYEMDLLSYPDSSQGLAALIEVPSGLANESKWRGPYLEVKVLPLDPWDNAYHYELIDAETYRVASAGGDRTLGTEDDITN
jgi:general secretion pathway protein G